MKAVIGYCAITADPLHIGHVRYLKKCKERCWHLIVGVMSDYYIYQHKARNPFMSFKERKEIVQGLRDCGEVIEQIDYEFPMHILKDKKVYGNHMIIFDTKEHSREGADVILERTASTSSTELRERICGCL